MLTFSIVVAVFVLVVYAFRRNFRRSFYVLWTGDEKPDWDAVYRRWYGEEEGTKLWGRDGRTFWTGF